MESALIALIGVLIGLLIGEIFRRRARIEPFAAHTFERRLEVYEGLYAWFDHAHTIGSTLFENRDLTPAERKEVWGEAFAPLALYLDEHPLFVPEEVGMQLMLTIADIDQTSALEDEEARAEAYAAYVGRVRDSKRIIREASGLTSIEKAFQSITGTKPDSELLEKYRELRKDILSRPPELSAREEDPA